MSMIRLKYCAEGTVAKPVQAALRLSQELNEQYGLVRGKDYTWHFSSSEKELHVLFHSAGAEQVSSIVAMKYLGRDINEI